MARICVWLFGLCVLFNITTVIRALYEDQAGKFDWRQQYVGGVEHVILDQCGQSICKWFIVGTDQHVITSLNMRNGEIVWRQIQEKSDSGRIDDMILLDNSLVAVMGGGSYLRCFSVTSGVLNWEFNAEVSDLNQRSRIAFLTMNEKKKIIVMLTANTVYGFDISGRLQWKEDLPNSDKVKYGYLKVDENAINIIGVTMKSHVVIITMDTEGTMLPKYSAPAAWIQDGTRCQFSGDQFVCLDVDNRIVHQLSLQKPEIFRSSLFQDLKISCNDPQLMNDVSDGHQREFGIRCLSSSNRGDAVVLRASEDGIKLVKELSGVTALQVVRYGEQDVFITMARSKPEECEMKGYELSSGLELSELLHTFPVPGHHGFPIKLYGIIKKKDNSPVFRMIALSQDDSVVLLQQTGKLTWVREEALSKVVAIDMIDLPVSPMLAKMEDEFGTNSNDIFGMLINRLTTQFVQIQDFFFQILNHFKSHRHSYYDGDHGNDYMSDDDTDEDDDDYLFRDEFNIRKIIILASEVGKVCGLYSPSGRILWCHLLPDMAPFEAAGKHLYTISMQRTTSHFPHDPYCTIMGKHKDSGLGMMYRFNPVSGLQVANTPPGGEVLNYRIKQMIMLSHMDDHFIRPLVILDTDLKFHVYPESTTDLVKSLADSLFIMTTDTVTSQLYGYSMVYSDDKGLTAEEVWNLNLAIESQRITNIVFKQPLEHVHSQGIVLADRSVSYKYLNPNLVVITAEGSDSSQKGFVNVYLVDSVSGQLVFHCNHKRVKGPVHVVHSENWIVYDYWNQRHRRTEIAVLELYEGKKQNNATAFSSLYPPPIPLVLRQAYIISAHVSTMAVTITEKGITNKHLLLALETGAILEMQKALLDPRRPDVPTQEHREEGIIPYVPELPRHNEAVINYNRSVYNVRAIHTAPAGLESHSIILCYGLDIFYTRVMPSKMFDVLKEDFDYFFIGSVTLGMIIVSLLSKKLAARKALNRAWK